MKLLYIHERPIDFGTADIVQVLSMCNAFSKIGIDVYLIVPERSDKNVNIAKFVKREFGLDLLFKIFEEGIPPEDRIRKYLISSYIDRIVSQITPDICYVRSPRLLKNCLNKGLPTIYENHNYILHQGSSLLNFYYKYWIKKKSKDSKFLKLVTINIKLESYWRSIGIHREKIVSYHDGFIKSNYEKSISIHQARDKLGIEKGKKIVVYTGNLLYGIEMYFILLAKKFKNVVFYIVGGTDAKVKKIQDIINKESISNIVLTGSVPHKNVPLYQFSGDVLLAVWPNKVPHIDSISPLKLFEYMASGRVIVAHEYSTIKEVIKHEQNALLASPKSVEDLMMKLREALQLDYPNLLSKNARKEAFENYTWEKRAQYIISSLN